MPRIWVKIITVSVLALVMAVSLTWATALAFKSNETNLMIATATWVTLIIAPLLSFVFFKQGAEVNRLVKQLNEAHAQLQAAYLQVEEQARLDGLTGLLNRTAFFSNAEKLIAGGSRGALLIVDIDHFKAVNDTFGHSVGDVALFATASCIADTLDGDTVIGRLGGEEFGVLLPGVSAREGYELAERVRLAVHNRVRPGPSNQPITISIGCARFGNVEFQRSYEEADANLYHAKRGGRNQTNGLWRAA